MTDNPIGPAPITSTCSSAQRRGPIDGMAADRQRFDERQLFQRQIVETDAASGPAR